MLSKKRKIFIKIYNKILDKIDELSKENDYADFKFIANSSCSETSFNKLKDPVAFLDNILKREILIQKVPHKKEEFSRYLKHSNRK